MDDLLSEFITETSESLTEVDLQLVEFEKDPQNAAILGNIFRLVHTVKGTCGFLGLPRLESVAHAGENVLDKYRDGALAVTPDGVSLVLKCIDTIRGLVDELAETAAEPEGDDAELIAKLNALANGESVSVEAAPAAAPAPASSGPTTSDQGFPVAAELLAEYEQATGGDSSGPTTSDQGFPVAAELLAEYEQATGGDSSGPTTSDQGFPVAAELLAEYEQATGGGEASEDEIAAAEMAANAEMERLAAEFDAEPEAAPEAASVPAAAPSVPATTAAAAPAAKKEPAKAAAPAAKGDGGGGVTASLRVNVDVLENLMTLVSEMVLTRNQLLQMIRGSEDSEFTVPIQRLSHITTDLQEGVMKTRMQPIGNAWAKLPRIVRDLSIETGKKIDLQMLGAETELDRQVLDLIKDPLTHMVRNSADHGLETPAERVAMGKPETGTITLNAYHEGGHIIIDIADDGKGLNMERIRVKCIENGLTTESELDAMSDQQIQQYIFKAGFSTAEKVTSVSGRGVGMDVVRTNIEKIGGTIELKSEEGRGSTFTIKIPLTLAIVAALIVESCGEKFAIPQISVLELVRASARSEYSVEVINHSPVLRLRNRLLPLVHLGDLLKLSTGGSKEIADETFIIVAQVGTYSFGIIVDRVFDTEEIVVKPTSPVLRDIPVYSGNTILGDGSVIMILDPNGIAASTGEVGASPEAEASAEDQVGSTGDERVSMLIFRAGGDELKAVPLALVARLEEIDMADVEVSHGEHMVQYRGQLMPLIPFSADQKWMSEGRQAVLVFTESERSMGLVVDEIVDIVEDRLKVEITANRSGLIGSAVIDGRATDVIDAGYYLTQAFPDWFGGSEEDGSGLIAGKHALLVDDSPFFRNLLAPILSVAGFNVTTAESATEALVMRDRGSKFDVIISDIEMPEMDGFAFAEEVRRDPRWGEIPMVALSAHATDRDFERGRSVGFNDYVAKADRDELVRSLAMTVNSVTT
ncbi:chemotaxis protein CheW [Magnetovibrio sp.]|uniref:hybrid sensor histidine kinase/response regulator n=1 Tax=Magnetovibrio sp. TaxID=2024836 RepID=UPI002F93A8DD